MGVGLPELIVIIVFVCLIMQFIVFPIFLFSSAFFPVKNLPTWLQWVSLIDPLTYGVDGIRLSLIKISQFPLFLDLIVLVIFDLIMIMVATQLFNRTKV